MTPCLEAAKILTTPICIVSLQPENLLGLFLTQRSDLRTPHCF